MVSYFVTFVVTVYREFFCEPNSNLHVMSRGFISLHAKPHKTHVYWPGGYEALGFARASTPPLFGFTGSFMMVYMNPNPGPKISIF